MQILIGCFHLIVEIDEKKSSDCDCDCWNETELELAWQRLVCVRELVLQ